MSVADVFWNDCDFIEGSKSTYINALNHIKMSEYAFENINAGIAVSHQILAAEELIKSLFLLIAFSNDNLINNDEMKEMFKNHSFKHRKIKNILYSLINKQIDDFDKNMINYIVNPQEMKCKYQNIIYSFFKTFQLDTLSHDDFDEIDKLLTNANDYKNKGFYVDYRNKWVYPWHTTEDEYISYKLLTNKLAKIIEPAFGISAQLISS